MVDKIINSKYVLVSSTILPEVYRKVLRAKAYIATGEALSATQATKMVGISRSAYYKYKDSIFEYSQSDNGEVMTLFANLIDNPGVLSNVMRVLYRAGVNLLSVNQSIPVNNVASVSLTIEVAQLTLSLDELLEQVRELSGVKSIDEIKG